MALHVLDDFNSLSLNGYVGDTDNPGFMFDTSTKYEGGGSLQIDFSDSSSTTAVIIKNEPEFIRENGEITFYFQTSEDGYGLVYFLAQNTSNGYRVRFNSTSMRLEKVVNGTVTELGVVSTITTATSSFAECKITFLADGQIRIVSEGGYTANAVDSTFSSGKFGVGFITTSVSKNHLASHWIDYVTFDGELIVNDGIPPGDVTNLTETHTYKSASLSWNNPTDTDFSHIKILRDGELLVDEVKSSSFNDMWLASNKTYEYKLISVDIFGNESNGTVINVTTDPSTLTIVTDGLIGYWHFEKGFDGSLWENISPNTEDDTSYTGIVTGAVLENQGIKFDGEDDKVIVSPSVNEIADEFTYDFCLKLSEITPPSSTGSIRSYILSYGSLMNLQYVVANALGIIARGFMIPEANQDKLSRVGSNNIEGDFARVIYTYKKNPDGTTSYSRIWINDFYVEIPSSSYQEIHPVSDIQMMYNSETSFNSHTKGILKYVRIYNRALTTEEVEQNLSTDLGIALPRDETYPYVIINSISKTIISDEPNMDRAVVKFTFTQDVVEWRVMTLGTSWDTGTLADSGGSVPAGIEISAEIDYTELSREGDNQINIYGKNADGIWTPYMDD